MKKIFTCLILLFGMILLGGCIDDGDKPTPEGNFSYYEQNLSKDLDYNTNLYLLNSLEFQVADPTVIYVDHGDQAGYFYAYGTSDDIRGYGIQSWRSKDLAHWESMGVAYKPDFNNTWANIHYWAPEIIYDKTDGLFYLFYSARADNGIYHLSVSYSEYPQGPFITPDGIKNANGTTITANKPVYDVTSANPAISSSIVRRNAIDISPFMDPVTGKKYIYFSYYDTFNQSEIFGMEMIDWFTPNYSTLKQLTAVGWLSVEAKQNNIISQRVAEGTINEGPFMIYEDGKYFLTLSVYGYTDEKYQVRQAIADDPLGTFIKVPVDNGGTVIATDPMWGHITSAGHHCFLYVGSELYIGYHTFLNRSDITDGRALAFDKVEMVNKNGKNVLHTNGPTYSLQPLPEEISGYTNIARNATITADNTAEGSNVSYLNDGVMSYLSYDSILEYEANTGVSNITLTWSNFVTARAIMIYNSVDFDYSFVNVSNIQMTYKSSASGDTKTVEMKDLAFDWDWNVDNDYQAMKPGGAVIAEFGEISVKSIKITISSVEGYDLAIPEIVVLGKNSDCGATTKFTNYTYTNPPFGSPAIITDGTTVGTNKDANLYTDFGYDVTHDDGSDDAYITQKWPYDQYAYFKDVYATKFYVEAEFSVTANKPYASDQYPKFGLTVSTVENTVFFFVDANTTFNRDAIGVAQRTLDNRDWDWDATEQNMSGVGINYSGGNFVKMAIIRDGNEFYMLVNDRVVMYYDHFNVFVEDYKAVPGFLSFNTEMLIKNYSATDDSDTVNEMVTRYAGALNGTTMGISNGYKTTTGWDLTTDDGTDDAYMINNTGGDQYTYFRDFKDSNFIAETKIQALPGLYDPYPKFGIVLIANNKEFFFYIDSNPSYTNNAVGYVIKSGGNWGWSTSVTQGGVSMNYNTAFTTLTIKKDGATITMYVNGAQVLQVSNIDGFGASDQCVVGILAFTTSVKITDYSITSQIS